MFERAMASLLFVALISGCSLRPPRATETETRGKALDLVEQGMALEQQGKYDAAIQRYLQARDLYATPQVYHRLGHSYAQMNDLQTARQYLKKAVEQAPDNDLAFYELNHVEEQLSTGMAAAAPISGTPRLNEAPPPIAQSATPNAPFAEVSVAPKQSAQEVQASDVYRTLFGQGSGTPSDIPTGPTGPTFLSDAKFHVDRARGYLEGGKTDLAVLEYKEAIARDPRNSTLRSELAKIYEKQGDPDKAARELVAAIKSNPRDAEALAKLSEMEKSGRYARQSEELIEQASQTGANDPEAQIALGDMYLKKERQEKAAEHYQRAHQLAPTSPKPLWKLGNLRRDVNDLAQAKRYYQEALKVDPTFVPALNNLAYMADNAGEYDQARGYLEAILRADPSWAKAYFNLAVLYETRYNDKTRAIEYYERYLQMGGDLEDKARNNIAKLKMVP
jgi:tetratricopeptide (TPR) repeat protein